MASYWQSRMAKAQDVISQKNRKQVERVLRKYYRTAAEGIINDFEATLNKLIVTMEDGRQPTPADLYKLDKYWELQSQVDKQLKTLNDRTHRRLLRVFKQNYFDIYDSISWKGLQTYSTIDDKAVMQVVNQIWCADGKSWAQRIWDNTNNLKRALNDELINCVASGRPSSYLKKTLMERFNVSFGRADALVRTELAHIQTQAATQRYKDYGIQMVEILADKDERRCKHCGELHGKRYPINAAIPLPAHPKCRCCVIPVVTGDNLPEV